MANLLIVKGPDAGQQFPLEQECCVVGRDPDVSIYLPSQVVSRHHAQVLSVDGAYFIEDLGSSNGTFHKGKRLAGRAELGDGDELRIGEYLLTFQGDTDSGGTEILIRERVDASSTNRSLFVDNPEQKLQIVLELSQHLGQSLELGPLLDQLLLHLLQLFPLADRGMVVLCEGERMIVRAQRSRLGDDSTARFSRTVLRQALKDGVGLLSEDVKDDARFSESTTLGDTEACSLICVPLIGHDGKRLGAVQLDCTRPDVTFQAEHLRLLATLGLQVAVVLENVALNAIRLREESLRRELALGRDIQQGFLPTDFSAPAGVDLEIFARVHPAHEVAGDLYDFFLLADGRLAFFLGDVSDKGIPAALFMVAVCTLCRHLAPTARGPAETLVRLNDGLTANNPSSMFVTLVHGIYDPRSGEVVVSSGGHPPPLRRLPNGQVEELNVPAGRLLGCLEGDPGVKETRFILGRGETLILYSDGYTEAAAPRNKEMFGLDRLREVLGGPRSPLALDACAEEARKAVERFIGGTEMQDDLTLLLLRRV